MAQDRAIFTMADQYFILFYLFILFYFIIIIYYLFYFSNSVKCPCNVIHDSVTLIFTFLIIIIIIIIIESRVWSIERRHFQLP